MYATTIFDVNHQRLSHEGNECPAIIDQAAITFHAIPTMLKLNLMHRSKKAKTNIYHKA